MDTSHENEISVCSTDDECDSTESEFDLVRPKRALPGSHSLPISRVSYLSPFPPFLFSFSLSPLPPLSHLSPYLLSLPLSSSLSLPFLRCVPLSPPPLPLSLPPLYPPIHSPPLSSSPLYPPLPSLLLSLSFSLPSLLLSSSLFPLCLLSRLSSLSLLILTH